MLYLARYIRSAQKIKLNRLYGKYSQERKPKDDVTVTKQEMTSFEYNMNHKYRGLAIIFNHEEFESKEPRRGTKKDVEAIEKILPLLGFERDNILVENDLTKVEVLSYIYRIMATKSDILKNCDCIAIFIMTHGSTGNRICAHDKDYDLYNLVELFTSNNCKELAGKPKLFVINAYRDNMDEDIQLRPEVKTVGDTIDSDQLVYSHPIHADILIGLSSHRNHFSFLDSSGSWYIQDLCETIKQFNKENQLATSDIHDLLSYTHFKVSQRVAPSDDIQLKDKKQIPKFISALCRKLYFKPKPKPDFTLNQIILLSVFIYSIYYIQYYVTDS